MIEFARGWAKGLPIRLRLTLWYVLLMGLTFAVLGATLWIRIQRSLVNSIDIALQIAVSQTIPSVEDETEIIAFDDEVSLTTIQQSTPANFALRLLSPQGEVLDTLGAAEQAPFWAPTEPGYRTLPAPKDDEPWRLFSQPIIRNGGEMVGWVQAAQSLEVVTDTLQDFRDQLLWGIPLALSMAGIGGYFLADRALRPINHITRMAQTIEAGDLSRRIAYRGPADEIGRLAKTFDQMLERLQAAFARERRFTEDAAHELRTPLTALKGQIEVALNRPRQPVEYQDALRDLASQVDRLIRLSNALLFLSRSDRDRNGWLPATKLNLKDLLEAVIEETRPLAEEKGLTLSAEIPAEFPVYGDADNLIRLFLNLLDNAIKYTPAGGQVHVLVEPVAELKTAETVQIRIHNSGPGIPPEHLPHLFDRFYRVDADRSRETGGFGLGLAIAREIVRLHEGEISVQSEPGQGATFIVHLPAPEHS